MNLAAQRCLTFLFLDCIHFRDDTTTCAWHDMALRLARLHFELFTFCRSTDIHFACIVELLLEAWRVELSLEMGCPHGLKTLA